ncbi:ATP-dependent DNA helicase RecG [Paenalkalicoccus suaedae]|uniref:ATP-dependent DNA helicase RecG n=1 Tax=Paenalkalicoccus suaedae TaxID=2592382 RepID=A0A859FDN4_9BACI|nr:ATP-dependent DNA helicase RecG [Paenalkalicoccus suaedae]QKS71473.1 ATP-dependent DNA helicase RecG [Paenalkalicoccus suaedae]
MTRGIQELSGIGAKAAERLSALGITTVYDLQSYFPFRYEDHSIRRIQEVDHEEKVTLSGTVHSEPELRFFRKQSSRLTVRVLVDGLLVQAIFFNQPYLKKQIELGQVISFHGKLDKNRLAVNGAKLIGKTEGQGLDPVYSLRGDIKMFMLRKWIKQSFDEFPDDIEEILPYQLMQTYKLMDRREAFYRLHFPEKEKAFLQAKRRMIYEELLLFQLKMQVFRKKQRESTHGVTKTLHKDEVQAFIASLPFPLTQAQDRVINEILEDLEGKHRMSRLLQGDVGSGKTVVAAVALYASVLAGYQGALMVPTEILAEQHVESLTELFANTPVRIGFLSGSSKTKERRETLAKLEAHEIDVLIGTHALIQEPVIFANLGLVITDEQHRFGVGQRRVLKEKGLEPDVLFMTATPIPRTLAISAFGDMDVSTIDEMPKGRKVVETHWAKQDMLPRVLTFIEKHLKKGNQAYVITPLIEESEKLDVQNAIELHQQLQMVLTDWNVGLMHGRLHATEKDEVMKQFAQNEVQVLVSTTVVEVGVNVPNATVMVIYDADRFGLAQLHQLRGRVGRGSDQAYCILLADPKSENGKERMQIMTETSNGFELSERDLELRGPGDFFGVKQSGLPELKVADIVEDYRILEIARDDATKLVKSTAFWETDDYRGIREELARQGAFLQDRLD